MKLHYYSVSYTFDGNGYTLDVYTATPAAAREATESYALETHGPGAKVRQVREVAE